MKDKENINFDRPRLREGKWEEVYNGGWSFNDPNVKEYNEQGRFPANIIFDKEAGKILDEQSGIKQYNKGREEGNYKGGHRKDYVGTDDNPIVNKVDGKFFNDKGGASRYFFCPKDEDENNEISSYGKWLQHQKTNYDKKIHIMKNDEIREKWKLFKRCHQRD
jgi:hypothetical protein